MNRDRWVSILSLVLLLVVMPASLKLLDRAQRVWVGAEGTLASISVETDRVLGPMPRPWEALAQGGEAMKTFLDDSASQISILKPKYIRIDHVFNGYNVVSRGPSGLEFNWQDLDKTVDKIQSVGAVPFFSVGYMPTVISKSDIVDAPKDWNEWSLIVQRLIERYSGERKIANVYYEVWNEPDLFGGWKMGGTKDYRTLYTYAARGAQNAKNVLDFKIGGPATTALYKNWMDYFFPYILQNNLRLDFFSWHRYNLDLATYIQDVTSVRSWIDSHPYFANVEMIVTELGPSSDKGQVNESTTGAAHLLATARELMYRIKYGFNFSIKDAPESVGGWGVLSASGLPKPRYQALKMLGMVGNQRLGVSGEGSWVRAIGAKKDDGTYQVLVVNYDPKNSHSEVVPVNFLSLQDRDFNLKSTWLEGTSITKKIATTEAILQEEVPMTANSAVLLELTPLK